MHDAVMHDAVMRGALRRWGAIAVGLLTAFVLMAPLLAGLAEGDGLDARPAFFLVGMAALVKVAPIAFDKYAKSLYLHRIRVGLVLAGIVYFFASVLISA